MSFLGAHDIFKKLRHFCVDACVDDFSAEVEKSAARFLVQVSLVYVHRVSEQ